MKQNPLAENIESEEVEWQIRETREFLKWQFIKAAVYNEL